MAKSGAKKQLLQNQKRLKLLQQIVIASNVAVVVGRLIIFRGGNTWKLYATALAMSLAQVLCYQAVDRMADITVASIASYYQDVIYVCAFVQVFCVLTDKAFWAFWLLPLLLGFIIYTTLVQPLMQQRHAPKAAQETAAEKKQREKAEKKAAKPKYRSVKG